MRQNKIRLSDYIDAVKMDMEKTSDVVSSEKKRLAHDVDLRYEDVLKKIHARVPQAKRHLLPEIRDTSMEIGDLPKLLQKAKARKVSMFDENRRDLDVIKPRLPAVCARASSLPVVFPRQISTYASRNFHIDLTMVRLASFCRLSRTLRKHVPRCRRYFVSHLEPPLWR